MKTMRHPFGRLGMRCLVGLAAVVVSAAAMAQNAIEHVSGSLQGGTEVVRIDMAEPLSKVPEGFVVQSPARIALDFPGVGSKLPRGMIELNQGNLRSAQVVQGGERSRVVLSLKQATNYRATISGKTVLITLDPVAAATVANVAPRTFAPSVNRHVMGLRHIDFRRGADNSGRIVVDLPSSQVGVDIKPQGQNLVVDFLKSSLPPSLSKRLDVTDFGTPVQSVTTTQTGDRVHMVIAARGEWEHSAYQSDNQLVIEVHPLQTDPNKLTQGRGYHGEKLSLNFQNIEIRALLQVIADFTNFNIVTSDSVNGSVTLRLKDVPWDQALDIILQAKGLGMKKSGNVIWIAPKDELAAKEKQELENRKAVSDVEPLQTQSFQLNYAKAVDIAKGLSGQSSSGGSGNSTKMLSARGSVIAESRTNQLFVTDVPSVLEQVQALVQKLDVPVRQVMIEARIVEATDSWGRSLGAKLGINGTTGTGRGSSTSGGIGIDTSNSTKGGTLFNLPATAQNGYSAAAMAVSIFSSGASRFLTLEISALEADGEGKVVSSPRVVTADQTMAIIEQGTELPYQSATSSGATSVQFRKANLKLEVTPQVTPEGNVIMDVDVTNDSVGQATTDGYAINTKHVQTNVLVENGGTVVIGGIYTMTNNKDVTKVPLLGDIPILGNLFKNTTKSTKKTELLVFISPKIVSSRAAMQ